MGFVKKNYNVLMWDKTLSEIDTILLIEKLKTWMKRGLVVSNRSAMD